MYGRKWNEGEDYTFEILKEVCKRKDIDIVILRKAMGTAVRIKKLLESGKLWDYIIDKELGKRVIGHIKEREMVFCFMAGKLVKNAKPASLNLLMKGDSGSGKDWIVSSVEKLWPEEDVEYFGRATPKAFNYVNDSKENPDYTYDGKVVYLEEITEPTLNGEVMKVWMSGRNRMVSVERGKSVVKEPKGKPVIIATSYSSVPSIEMLNRLGVLYCKQTLDQKRKVKEQRLRVAQDGLEENYDPEIKNFLGGLKRYKVRIPFALKMSKHLPDEIQGESRVIDRICEIIKIIAVFHQDLKRKESDGFIIADERDYEIARNIIENLPVGFPDFLLSEKQREIIKVLEKQDAPLGAQEILDEVKLPITIQKFRPHLQRLVDIKRIEAIPLWNEKHYQIDKYQLIVEEKKIFSIKLPPFLDL